MYSWMQRVSSHQSLSRVGLGSKSGPELRKHMTLGVRQENDGSLGPKMVSVSSSLKKELSGSTSQYQLSPLMGIKECSSQ